MAKSLSDKIPSDLLQMLKEEFSRSMRLLTIKLRKQAEESVDIMEKSGVKVLPTPMETDLKDFYKVHDQVAQSLEGRIYSKELLDRVYGILRGMR